MNNLIIKYLPLNRLVFSRLSLIRLKSSKSFDSSDIQVSLTEDGQTIVCLHPEPLFPYKHSKPLPEIKMTPNISDSIIKSDLLKDTDNILFRKDYSEEDLIRLTHTSRTTWKQRFYNPKAKPNPPKNRDGI